jgi:histidine racemase
MKTYVITAAGGNPTAIRTIKNQLTRKNYEKFGGQLMLETEKYGVEQAGFLLQKPNNEFHFEMSGGEFCGNAARSVALVISQITGKSENSFTMSGYPGLVQSKVTANHYVCCEFKGLPTVKQDIQIEELNASVVDLGGIVHVVIESEFPKDYEIIHNKITKSLNLQNRDAVGVIWIKRNGDSVRMDPVVWVKSINTFFYETACGSGTIAVSATTGVKRITQPSGQDIFAMVEKDTVILESEMKIVFENQEQIL